MAVVERPTEEGHQEPQQPAEGDMNRPTTRVVLSHWAAHGARTSERRWFLPKLMLLSLLYDEVLLQDEFLVLDANVARWFGGGAFRQIENLADTGAIQILRHPSAAYPSEELRYLAQHKNPILARSLQIQSYATKGAQPFRPSDAQQAFHTRLDGLLASRGVARSVNATTDFPIMQYFESILRSLLTTQRAWSSRTYHIPGWVSDEFLRLLDDPIEGIRRLHREGTKPKFIMKDDRPVINRSFTYQLAQLFPEPTDRRLQSLIQTAFAAPFTWREGAVGTYGRGLRELLVTDSYEATIAANENPFGVEAEVASNGALPIDTDDFGAVIAQTRESRAGRQLRDAVSRLGSQSAFDEQRAAWLEVTDQMTSSLERTMPIRLRTILATGVMGLVGGAFVEGIVGPTDAAGLISRLPLQVLSALGGTLAGVSGPLLYSVASQYGQSAVVRSAIERAVTFRCTTVPVPSFLAGVVPPGYGPREASPG